MQKRRRHLGNPRLRNAPNLLANGLAANNYYYNDNDSDNDISMRFLRKRSNCEHFEICFAWKLLNK